MSTQAPIGDRPFEDLLPANATAAQMGEAWFY